MLILPNIRFCTVRFRNEILTNLFLKDGGVLHLKLSRSKKVCLQFSVQKTVTPNKVLSQLKIIPKTTLVFKITKVVPIIKCTCTVFIDNFRNISNNSSIKVSVCRGSYDGYVKHKRNNPTYDPWDSQRNENAVSISIAF